jgi:hypothetical protein
MDNVFLNQAPIHYGNPVLADILSVLQNNLVFAIIFRSFVQEKTPL